MGLLGKAFDNFDGINNAIGNLLETERSIERTKALNQIAYGGSNTADGMEAILLAGQRAQELQYLQDKERVAKRRYNILKDPELNKQIQAKRIELLEKTGMAVPINDIIDVYFGHISDDGLTPEEEEELAAIQKQFEDEEEAKVDAELAEQERRQEELATQRAQKSTKSQGVLTVVNGVLLIFFIVLVAVFLAFLFVLPKI